LGSKGDRGDTGPMGPPGPPSINAASLIASDNLLSDIKGEKGDRGETGLPGMDVRHKCDLTWSILKNQPIFRVKMAHQV
jgi:hypothetical protein